MKKIMFSDRYGLTQAVLDGRKTMTRRIISESLWDKWTEYDDFCSSVGVGGLAEIGVDVSREYSNCEKFFLDRAPFKVGEIVAIAQAYRDIWQHLGYMTEIEAKQCAGYSNKMFVRADLMPHQIRITNVRVERLQDISDEDCEKEGIRKWTKDYEIFKYDLSEGFEIFKWIDKPRAPRSAYAALIDRISGKGTWHSNPYVFAYSFELVK